MKIIYFHGFGSSGASGTVEHLRNLLPEDQVIAPDISVDPVEALPYLKQLCAQEQPDIEYGWHVCAADEGFCSYLYQSGPEYVHHEQCTAHG